MAPLDFDIFKPFVVYHLYFWASTLSIKIYWPPFFAASSNVPLLASMAFLIGPFQSSRRGENVQTFFIARARSQSYDRELQRQRCKYLQRQRCKYLGTTQQIAYRVFEIIFPLHTLKNALCSLLQRWRCMYQGSCKLRCRRIGSWKEK
jgi:hypothetical protein